jgi:hypothetical protein
MTDAIIAPEGESFPDVDRLNIFFKRKLAKAKREDEPAIRDEWNATKARWYGEHPQPPPQPPAMSEAEAIEAARKAYGASASGSLSPGRVAASIPTPIEIHWPEVGVITDEENP